MKSRKLAGIAVALIMAAAAQSSPASSAQSVKEFYTNKVIKIIVPFNPGGGFDAYSRLLSRHMPRYISGNPPMILQFMPGAGGLKSANYFYTVSPKNGTVMALLSQTMPLFQALKGKQAGRGCATTPRRSTISGG